MAKRFLIPAAVVGVRHDQKRDCIGALNCDAAVMRRHSAAIVNYSHPRLELHPRLAVAVPFLPRPAVHHQRLPVLSAHLVRELTPTEARGESDLPGLVTGQTRDDHTIWVGGQELSREMSAADSILDTSHTLLEIKQPPVIANFTRTLFPVEEQICHRKMCAVGFFAAQKMLRT